MKTAKIFYPDGLFTAVLLPEETGTFPIVIERSPYVDAQENMTDEAVGEALLTQFADFLDHGFAVVWQHCRGTGKSAGEFCAYVNERADGLALRAWLRGQPFYNGEFYLAGGSYLSTVHLVTAPFEPDVKAAALFVQDSERYNVCYRNGFFKLGLHGNWFVGNYHKKQLRDTKKITPDIWMCLPLTDLPMQVFGEACPNLDATFRAPDRSDPYWLTHEGGADSRGALDHAGIPILLRASFYDIYTGGLFDMWNAMSPETRAMSAMVVTPNDHGDNPKYFENSRIDHIAGANYARRWFEAVRGGTEPPVPRGKLTYYRLFEDRWDTAEFLGADRTMRVPLGTKTVSYTYDPENPPSFRGGLSACFGGAEYQDKPGLRDDIVTVWSAPFAADTFVAGKMKARLAVSSDCEDTCFYIRVSLETAAGDFGLRDDIRSIVYERGDYTPGETAALDFLFDEHAFLVKAGQRLRIDIASADAAHYVRHTNMRGLYAVQTEAKAARNTVELGKSWLELPVE